tara:strand:- start:360 stop:1226 length:867 start_codon:yes stop_codon:yes gene_type:complete
MHKVKHSKLRNTGLLYEFLLRQVTADVLELRHNKAITIIKECFSDKTELGKELALYNILTTKKYKTDKKAEYFINEVLRYHDKINKSILRREKYNLIKTLKETYDLQKFMSSKVRNYKLYASIYKLLEFKNKLSPDVKTESFFIIAEHITTHEKNISLSETLGGAKLPQNEDLRIITYKTLLEKFNTKYSKLNLPQKSLLKAYINNISGTNSLKEYIAKIAPVLKKEISKNSGKVRDKIVKIKLKEVIKNLNSFCGVNAKSKMVKDNHVIQLMRYYELLKELKKSGQK